MSEEMYLSKVLYDFDVGGPRGGKHGIEVCLSVSLGVHQNSGFSESNTWVLRKEHQSFEKETLEFSEKNIRVLRKQHFSFEKAILGFSESNTWVFRK